MVANNRALILDEAQRITGFMHLLMKPRNTGKAWTGEERQVLRMHLKHLSCYVPVMIIFVMPFGSLLIPVLAEILDRRGTHRKSQGNNLDTAGHGRAVL
ncbi:MAG: hypothetical protein H6Q52_154 [Deltaproteobacteria bacterium]|nr:hypothetical protein [Deltaproteobacteria bacterium]